MNRIYILSLVVTIIFLLLPRYAIAQKPNCTDKKIADIERLYEREASFRAVLDSLNTCQYRDIYIQNINTRAERLKALSRHYLAQAGTPDPSGTFKDSIKEIVKMNPQYDAPDSDPPFFKAALYNRKRYKFFSDRNYLLGGLAIGTGIAIYIATQDDKKSNNDTILPGPPREP